MYTQIERTTLKIERMNKGEWGKIKAFFDLRTDEGFVIKGFKLIHGINGLFVGNPSQKGNDGEYYDTKLGLLWQKRAYEFGIYYHPNNEAGGLYFRINGFNFDNSVRPEF